MCSLSHLRSLYLGNNNLKWLPHELSKLTRLEELGLEDNQLQNIPGIFIKLKLLKVLNLTSNKFHQIPSVVYQLPKLEELYMYDNQLKNLSDNIIKLSNLTELDVSYNKFQSMLNVICKMTQLVILDLSQNNLCMLPDSICQLLLLKHLYLQNNKLRTIPNEINLLTRLETLDLSSNNLIELPMSLIYLNNMNEFNGHDNPKCIIHPAIVRWMNQTKENGFNSVYNSSQSVHNDNIEITTNESIKKFITTCGKPKSSVTKLINTVNITLRAKKLLMSRAESNYIHHMLRLTYSEILAPILDYIITHENRIELEKILNDEVCESDGKCLQGQLSRLINVLSGYHEAVNIKISDNEQISNVIINLKKKMIDSEIGTFVDKFVHEMNERGFDQVVVDKWTMYIKENY